MSDLPLESKNQITPLDTFSDSDSAENLSNLNKSLYEFAVNQLNLDVQQIEAKKNEFRAYFDSHLFNSVIHASPGKIEADAQVGKVILKSPELLGFSNGSGDKDSLIGNTKFIFCCFENLKPIAANQRHKYVIESRDCRVVPVDLAYTIWGSHHTRNYPEYRKNMLMYSDFIELFVTYCSVIFDSPAEAVAIFEYLSESHAIDSGEWDEDFVKSYDRPKYIWRLDKDITLEPYLEKMSKLIQLGVFPPASPELQFRDQVEADLRIEQE